MLISEKILIVDPNEATCRKMVGCLGQDFDVLTADSNASALAALRTSAIAAVLLSVSGPEEETRALLEQRRYDPDFEKIPVLIVMNGSEKGRQSLALKLGAWDYVSPNDDPEIIRMRVHLAIVHSDQASYRRLTFLAHYDPLTETYNKKTLFEASQALLRDHPNTKFAFVRFDVDNFRLIDRFFGTEEGDKLLRYFAKHIPHYVENYGIYAFGRIERDVFGICVPYLPRLESDMEQIRAKLVHNDWNYSIVPSFGVYIIQDATESMDHIYYCASLAAETRKGHYFQCAAFYDKAMEDEIRREQEIQNGMADALEKGRFVVYLQPKYSLQDDCFSGSEALVRWIDAEKGVISPGDFVPIFEKNGFIAKLDYFVWESVCKLLHTWIEAGKTPLPISVNVSRIDLCDIRLTDRIVALVRRYKVPPQYLHLEITESAYSTNPEMVKAISAALQLHGFKVLMDDFGSGYSSLNMLKDISVDEVKLDMRFFSGEHATRRGEDIVVAMIHMAKWLHIPVIAEGVETKQEVDFLRRAGCEYIQGYYFGKPAPVSVYEQALANGEEPKHLQARFNEPAQSIRQLQEKMFDTVLDGMAICEFAGDTVHVRRANDSFARFFALLGRDISEKENFLDALPSVEQEQLVTMLYKAEFSRSVVRYEHHFERPDGSQLWADITLRYLARNGNACLQTISICDITAQKNVQDQSAT